MKKFKIDLENDPRYSFNQVFKRKGILEVSRLNGENENIRNILQVMMKKNDREVEINLMED